MTLRENIRRALCTESTHDFMAIHRWLAAQTAWPVKRPAFARMMKMVLLFADGRAFNCSDLAAMFSVSTKTAFRDIDFLRQQLAIPIKYDTANRVYKKESL